LDHLSADADARHDDALNALMENLSHAKAQRRKESHLEIQYSFAPLRLCVRNLLLLIFVFAPPLVQIARADGGVVLWQQTSAPFTITVFSTDMPLRPGLADLSVLLEPTDGPSPILDAQVFIELEHEAGTIIRAEATRSQARNKLLYCSLINLPKSGQWKMRLHVRRGDSSAEVLSDLIVAAPQPVLLSHWELIAVPPIIIGLFITNQRLRRKRVQFKPELN
jgi:hypothetical protein